MMVWILLGLVTSCLVLREVYEELGKLTLGGVLFTVTLGIILGPALLLGYILRWVILNINWNFLDIVLIEKKKDGEDV